MPRKQLAELPSDTPVPVVWAHDIVGVSRATVYRWIDAGYLKPDTSGERWTVTPAQVREAEARARENDGRGGDRRQRE